MTRRLFPPHIHARPFIVWRHACRAAGPLAMVDHSRVPHATTAAAAAAGPKKTTRAVRDRYHPSRHTCELAAAVAPATEPAARRSAAIARRIPCHAWPCACPLVLAR
eukprot:361177-Chlamydomonas_euryale.AAC.4